MDQNQQQNNYQPMEKQKFSIWRAALFFLLVVYVLFLISFIAGVGDTFKCAKETSGPCTTAGYIGSGILFASGLFGVIIVGIIHSLTSFLIRKCWGVFEKITFTIILFVTIGFILFFCWWIVYIA